MVLFNSLVVRPAEARITAKDEWDCLKKVLLNDRLMAALLALDESRCASPEAVSQFIEEFLREQESGPARTEHGGSPLNSVLDSIPLSFTGAQTLTAKVAQVLGVAPALRERFPEEDLVEVHTTPKVIISEPSTGREFLRDPLKLADNGLPTKGARPARKERRRVFEMAEDLEDLEPEETGPTTFTINKLTFKPRAQKEQPTLNVEPEVHANPIVDGPKLNVLEGLPTDDEVKVITTQTRKLRPVRKTVERNANKVTLDEPSKQPLVQNEEEKRGPGLTEHKPVIIKPAIRRPRKEKVVEEEVEFEEEVLEDRPIVLTTVKMLPKEREPRPIVTQLPQTKPIEVPNLELPQTKAMEVPDLEVPQLTLEQPEKRDLLAHLDEPMQITTLQQAVVPKKLEQTGEPDNTVKNPNLTKPAALKKKPRKFEALEDDVEEDPLANQPTMITINTYTHKLRKDKEKPKPQVQDVNEDGPVNRDISQGVPRVEQMDEEKPVIQTVKEERKPVVQTVNEEEKPLQQTNEQLPGPAQNLDEKKLPEVLPLEEQRQPVQEQELTLGTSDFTVPQGEQLPSKKQEPLKLFEDDVKQIVTVEQKLIKKKPARKQPKKKVEEPKPLQQPEDALLGQDQSPLTDTLVEPKLIRQQGVREDTVPTDSQKSPDPKLRRQKTFSEKTQPGDFDGLPEPKLKRQKTLGEKSHDFDEELPQPRLDQPVVREEPLSDFVIPPLTLDRHPDQIKKPDFGDEPMQITTLQQAVVPKKLEQTGEPDNTVKNPNLTKPAALKKKPRKFEALEDDVEEDPLANQPTMITINTYTHKLRKDKEKPKPQVQPMQEEEKPLIQTVQEEEKPLIQTVQEEEKPLIQTVQDEEKPLIQTVQDEEKPLIQTVQEKEKPLIQDLEVPDLTVEDIKQGQPDQSLVKQPSQKEEPLVIVTQEQKLIPKKDTTKPVIIKPAERKPRRKPVKEEDEVEEEVLEDLDVPMYTTTITATRKQPTVTPKKTDEQVQPVVNGKVQPQQQEELPDLHDQVTPVVREQDQPVVQEEIKPVVQEEIKPVVQEEIKPVVQEEIKPVIQKEIKPVVQEEIKPVVQEEIKPVIQEEINPVIQKEIKPVVQDEVQPVIDGEIKPQVQPILEPERDTNPNRDESDEGKKQRPANELEEPLDLNLEQPDLKQPVVQNKVLPPNGDDEVMSVVTLDRKVSPRKPGPRKPRAKLEELHDEEEDVLPLGQPIEITTTTVRAKKQEPEPQPRVDEQKLPVHNPVKQDLEEVEIDIPDNLDEPVIKPVVTPLKTTGEEPMVITTPEQKIIPKPVVKEDEKLTPEEEKLRPLLDEFELKPPVKKEDEKLTPEEEKLVPLLEEFELKPPVKKEDEKLTPEEEKLRPLLDEFEEPQTNKQPTDNTLPPVKKEEKQPELQFEELEIPDIDVDESQKLPVVGPVLQDEPMVITTEQQKIIRKPANDEEKPGVVDLGQPEVKPQPTTKTTGEEPMVITTPEQKIIPKPVVKEDEKLTPEEEKLRPLLDEFELKPPVKNDQPSDVTPVVTKKEEKQPELQFEELEIPDIDVDETQKRPVVGPVLQDEPMVITTPQQKIIPKPLVKEEDELQVEDLELPDVTEEQQPKPIVKPVINEEPMQITTTEQKVVPKTTTEPEVKPVIIKPAKPFRKRPKLEELEDEVEEEVVLPNNTIEITNITVRPKVKEDQPVVVPEVTVVPVVGPLPDKREDHPDEQPKVVVTPKRDVKPKKPKRFEPLDDDEEPRQDPGVVVDVTKNTVKPVVTEEDEPVIKEEEKKPIVPVITEEEKPVVKEEEKKPIVPVVTEEEKPVVTEEPKPKVEEEPKPVVTEEKKPVVTEEPKPTVKEVPTTPKVVKRPTEEESPEDEDLGDEDIEDDPTAFKLPFFVYKPQPGAPKEPEALTLRIQSYHGGSEGFHGKTIFANQLIRELRENELSEEEAVKRLLLLFKMLPVCVQAAISMCRGDAPESGMPSVGGREYARYGSVFAIKCGAEEEYFNGACYAKCPRGFENYKLFCRKPEYSPRSVKTEREGAESLFERYSDDLAVEKCQAAFSESAGPNYCRFRCPLGWKDYGQLCQKPARFRNQNLFLNPDVVVK